MVEIEELPDFPVVRNNCPEKLLSICASFVRNISVISVIFEVSVISVISEVLFIFSF